MRDRLRTVSVPVRLPHGHIWTFGEVDAFVDSRLKKGVPLPMLAAMKVVRGEASASVASKYPVVKGELNYTSDVGPWQKREWKAVPATLQGGTVRAALPLARPLVYYLSVTDQRGLRVATPHLTLPPALQ